MTLVPSLPAPGAPSAHPIPQGLAWHAGGVVIAAGSRRAMCALVNAAAVIIASGLGLAFGWAWAILLGVGVAAWEMAEFLRTGRSAGHQVTGLRTVDKTTGMPGTLAAVLARRCVAADLRVGRDPLRLVPLPLPRIAPIPPPPPPPARPGVFTVVADDGSRFAIASPTLVGRGAHDPSGRYACVTIPDVSKTLSRNHALLEPAPDGLRVTDVGSGNGSAIVDGDHLHAISKYQSAAVRPGAQLVLGTRFFEVTYE